jgi:TetR/AcrR family transcriptional regulator, repressor of fatR-cypB operon
MVSPRTRRDGRDTRERLLRAGLELFTANGFLGTTTPALATRAGIAEGTIYRHFGSKEALLNAVYAESQRWLLRLLREAEGDRGLSAPGRLSRFAHRVLAVAAADPAQVRMALLPRDTGFLDVTSQEASREFHEALQHVVAMGKSDGQVRAGPADLWAAVWLAVLTFTAERVSSGEWTPEQSHAGLAIDAAWEVIAIRPAAATIAPRSPQLPSLPPK